MYLKSIEVQGFKSFANKLKFEFHEGITGIVGPNGSGKSNVADAVRWVLGEQSARQLRSGSMQDVIFAGTESRKPQSFASVAITFDNSDHQLEVDYEEVTVTRRLYRSGESEYLINQSPVRLRDINEIFYDTGIGQEGYSIIGQGQIERILSVKSEERRELFDEAAGIVKFKKRKRTALKKLEEEHNNLLRVTDVLNELTQQLGPLKKQYETAKIYLEQRDRLKVLEVNHFLLEDERAGAELLRVTDSIALGEHNMNEAKDRFEETRAEYEAIERELEEIQESVNALTEELSSNALIRQQLNGQREVLREQIKTVRTSAEQKEKRREQIEGDLRSKMEELEALTRESDSAAQKEREAEEREIRESEELEILDAELQSTASAIEKTKNDVIVMLQSRASVKGKLQRYDTMLEQLEIRRSEVNGRLIRLREDYSRAEKEAKTCSDELDEVLGRLKAIEIREFETEKKLESKKAELKTLNDRLDETNTGYHRDSSKLESLKSMAEHYEGYGLAIKKVMDLRGRNSGIRGVVADLIDVPKKYETAIETALGGAIRNIVTDNEATAKYLIEYLKTNKLGRATFLPLTSIKARGLTDTSVLGESGVIGTAASLVTTGEEYRVLAEHLLGRIVIIDHIDNAIRIGRKYRHSIYMVTLQGESFAPGGSITGGSFRSSDNLLGRKREIEELTENTRKELKSASELRAQIEKTRTDRNILRDQLSAVNDEEQKLRIRLNTVQLSARNANEQLQVSTLDMRTLEGENAEIEKQMAEVRDKNLGITKSLRESENSEKEADRTAEELREKEQKLKNARDEKAAALQKLHIENAAYAEQKRFRSENVRRLTKEMGALKDESQLLGEALSGSDEEILSRESQIRELQHSIEDDEVLHSEKTAQKESLLRKKAELSESHRDFFDKYDALQKEIAELDHELYRLNTQKDKLTEAKEERIEHMWEEYNLTPGEVRKYPLAEKRTDLTSLKRDISSVRGRIKQLGHVNVDAIEEYKAQSERYTFLSAQHEDLVKSEETLTGIIVQLDEGMRRQFSEKFSVIREEFDKAFKELFGGGHGTIEIEQNADILEADIQIIAHPPGKKLQNMMQLSGGEKALTAIALLFAIQNMKPSPFCLLDEIEAALDESNVIRFAEYLHKLTDNTQFIVITHRRGTMTAADRLYGITMQEKGISALVSVNLIEDKLTG